jgi:hypothetical protein
VVSEAWTLIVNRPSSATLGLQFLAGSIDLIEDAVRRLKEIESDDCGMRAAVRAFEQYDATLILRISQAPA